MALAEKIRRITDEIERRLEVAIQQDGYHQDENLIEVFDDYRACKGLSSYNDIRAQLLPNMDIPTYSKITKQFKIAEGLVKEYAKTLAIEAERENINLEKVSSEIYVRFARNFERKNKDKLVFTSPNSWLY